MHVAASDHCLAKRAVPAYLDVGPQLWLCALNQPQVRMHAAYRLGRQG